VAVAFLSPFELANSQQVVHDDVQLLCSRTGDTEEIDTSTVLCRNGAVPSQVGA
jgi:hypothetical protein